jgi:hypothetical protein
MANFLKVVSGFYLVFVWLIFAAMLAMPSGRAYVGTPIIAFLAAVAASIPAAVLFAFGQVVGDIRQMRDDTRTSLNNLRVMRRYYEPADQIQFDQTFERRG